MADILANLKDWSTTASSNLPADATIISGGLADNLQQIQATVRTDLASKGSDIASAATVDLGANAGYMHDITGTTTITSFGTCVAGISKILRFTGAATITYNATSMILPGALNITVNAGATALAISLGSGNWLVPFIATAPLQAHSGIKFPATQVASSDVNTLDDYEEGTWTPVVTFDTPGDVSVILSTAAGTYRKIGSQVIITCDAVTSTFTHTTASGAIQVTGLPFNSANVAGVTHSGAGSFQGITAAGYTDFSARLAANSGSVLIGMAGSGQSVANAAAADMPSAGSVVIRFTLPYYV